jgi:hypothetical protein
VLDVPNYQLCEKKNVSKIEENQNVFHAQFSTDLILNFNFTIGLFKQLFFSFKIFPTFLLVKHAHNLQTARKMKSF